MHNKRHEADIHESFYKHFTIIFIYDFKDFLNCVVNTNSNKKKSKGPTEDTRLIFTIILINFL